MKAELAQKMLDEKLEFLPLEESLALFESGVKIDTRFSWVVNSEEIEDNGYGMSNSELINEHHEIYGVDDEYNLKVGNPHNEFDEFTLEICPAPTYIDLIK